MHEIADGLMDPDEREELHGLIDSTHRVFHGRRAPITHVTPIGDRMEEIKSFARDHPRMSMFDIGRHFDINEGRVSEILSGKRDHLA